MEPINLDKIDSVEQLQALRGEEFVKREQAQKTISDCNTNINAISARINQVVEAAKVAKTPAKSDNLPTDK